MYTTSCVLRFVPDIHVKGVAVHVPLRCTVLARVERYRHEQDFPAFFFLWDKYKKVIKVFIPKKLLALLVALSM